MSRAPSRAVMSGSRRGRQLVRPTREFVQVGEDVAFVELSRAQARDHLARFMPEEVIDGSLDILGAPLPTERAVSRDVEQVLRRPARPFADWVARNVAAFR